MSITLHSYHHPPFFHRQVVRRVNTPTAVASLRRTIRPPCTCEKFIRLCPRSLGSSGPPSTAEPATAQKEEEGEGIGDAEDAGWTKEDEEALHCLCRLPADAARFRTLMTCDLCSSWFHPSCVRLKVHQVSRFAVGPLYVCQRKGKPRNECARRGDVSLIFFFCPRCMQHGG